MAARVPSGRRVALPEAARDHGGVDLQTGRDGKAYPAQMPPPAAWRWRVITLTHALAHERGLSVRATQRELAARGYRRSLGSISYDLSRQMPGCSWCRSIGQLRAGEATAWQPETTPAKD